VKKIPQGFTFIELLIGMVLIGVIAVVAVPRYVDAAQQAQDDALWAQSVAVKNAHDALVNKRAIPTIANLVVEMEGDAAAVAGGVRVQVSGINYVVPTYANVLCTERTKTVNEKIGCVGAIDG